MCCNEHELRNIIQVELSFDTKEVHGVLVFSTKEWLGATNLNVTDLQLSNFKTTSLETSKHLSRNDDIKYSK